VPNRHCGPVVVTHLRGVLGSSVLGCIDSGISIFQKSGTSWAVRVREYCIDKARPGSRCGPLSMVGKEMPDYVCGTQQGSLVLLDLDLRDFLPTCDFPQIVFRSEHKRGKPSRLVGMGFKVDCTGRLLRAGSCVCVRMALSFENTCVFALLEANRPSVFRVETSMDRNDGSNGLRSQPPKHRRNRAESLETQRFLGCDQLRTARTSGICTGVVRVQLGLSRRELHRRYRIGPQLRVNGHVRDKSSPSPYLRLFFPLRRFMGSDSVWLGDRHQGSQDIHVGRETKGSQGCHQKS
jgi:hypothetical protein